MELFEAMSSLRAVRRLRSDPVPDNVLKQLVEAATWAPTGGNVQPWRVVVVRDPGVKTRLAALYDERWREYAGFYRKRLTNAPEDARTRVEATLRAGDYLAAHFASVPAIFVFCFNPEQMAITDSELDRPSVVGGASVYPAVQNLLLAARAHGLGCVLTTLLCQCEPEVCGLLEIPPPWYTAAAVPVGWPVARGHGPLSRRPVAKMAFADRWDVAFE